MDTSLLWLSKNLAKPDSAYQHVVAENDIREFGPGPAMQWPLMHDDLYVCRIADMGYAENLRDAYEVGFRGRKREFTTANLVHLVKQNDAKLTTIMKKSTCCGEAGKITHITCDCCGEPLAGMNDDGFFPGPFYFCKRCKRNGNRYELCPACYQVECAQGGHKHLHRDPHPHFLHCDHDCLVRQRLLSEAGAGIVPEVRRVFCDYCGQLAGHCDADDEVWVCPKCPEERGVRFELCASCYQDLQYKKGKSTGMWDQFNPFAVGW